MLRTPALLIVSCFAYACVGLGADNSLTYLDEYADAYYPGTDFPKLTTPQWVGQAGVDAVVTLAIDDMRDTAKYEAFLRPILNRLKEIDGRAPVSIMTCSVDPNDPQLQSWINEGLSIEVHTVDHPCPCLQGGQFAGAKSTYDRCVDMMASIPGNKPVAFRTPCCDSRNTPSPRLWNEIFNRRTEHGNFLQADSSVFNVFTADDPQLPRDLVSEPDGTPRLKKYIPFPSFVNKIENYPYPYVIGKLCWQFPCMVPSDWEAQNLHQPNNPKTLRDMKAALDATVLKQGMFNLVFHPHGWIRSDQIIELIDYANTKYNGRVQFLTFRECVDRINENLLVGQPLRSPQNGGDNGVRIVDLNQDGFLDAMIGNQQKRIVRIWQPETRHWRDAEHPVQFTEQGPEGQIELGVQFGRLSPDGKVTLLVNNRRDQSIYEFSGDQFVRQPLPPELVPFPTSIAGVDQGVRLRDLDRNGVSEILIANPTTKCILKRNHQGTWTQYASMPFSVVDQQGRDNGVRFVDFDHDGHDDVIISNGSETGLRLFDPSADAFTRVVEDLTDVPLIVRDGTNNGAWFVADHMWVQNEDTNRLSDGVDRRTFAQLLGSTEPAPRSPPLSLDSIQVRPGFTVELMAAEPLVMDPIAIDWGADGKLWVVEMADYPLGLDDHGAPGGRVRYLEDTDDDGKYDKSTLLLDRIAFPTGVIAWQDGVIVSAAPTVFFAADRDGDGKAEVREDLYRGFGEGNQQHRVNGFERGLDNWLYLANGDSGGTVASVKTGTQVNIGGQDLRIRPEDGSLELQSGRTQFGRHRDDHGNWFGCSNPLPVRHFVLDDHYLRRNPFVASPPARRDIARVDNTQLFPISRVLSHWSGYKPPPPGSGHKFTSACSTMVYRDDLFGEEFAENTFTCEPVHNLVHRRRLISSGVSFESVRPDDETKREFLASSDSWFRPTTVTTGPDGALWIVDMYRLVIEHPEWIDDQREKELFLRAGCDRGRIYRVYPTGTKLRPIERLAGLDLPELVTRLASPNGRVRDLAQQLLVQRKDIAVKQQLEAMVKEAQNPLGRLHALCTLDGIGAIRTETLQVALADPDPTVRRHAIRIAEGVLKQATEPADAVLKALERCDATDPHVQLQLAYSLGESSSSAATDLLARLALTASSDPYIRGAVISSLSEANLSGFYTAISDDPATAERFRPSILEMAARMKNNAFLSQVISDLLDEIDVQDLVTPKLATLSDTLSTIRKQNVRLEKAIQARIDQLADAAMIRASDGDSSVRDRIAAMELVAVAGQHSSELLSLVAAREPVDVQVAAARAVVDRNAGQLLARFQSLSPAVQAAILDALLSREATSMTLLESLQQKHLPLHTIGPGYRQKLTAHVSKKVQSAAAELFRGTEIAGDRKDALARYSAASSLDGDAIRGQAVFAKQCAACHRVKEIGHVVGPDLAALRNRSSQGMLTAILDPNAAVEDKYRSYTVLTLDGVAETGIISVESSTAIELLLQDGKSKTILRDDIELLQSTGKSLMPEEMEKSISLADMSHLLAFLNDIGPPPKQFAGNTPVTVTMTDDGMIHLAATSCQIYGEQIRFEPQYKNIGYWNAPNDHVQWTLDIPQAGRYEVWLDYACPAHTAGNQFSFTCGDQTLGGKIKGTGTWNDYQQLRVGTIDLAEGAAVAALTPEPPLNQSLMDLREIKLKRVQ